MAWLGAMQAQDYRGALWAIGLRLPAATQRDVEQAIAERAIIRTWPMRGTLHFVAAADVRWMLDLLTPRIIAGSAGRHRQLELDDKAFARSQELFVKALQGNQQLTRDEMYEVLERGHISAAGQRGYHLLWRAAQEGLICFGPHSGKQPSFVLLDEWAPGAQRLPRDQALAQLTLRYFTGHGPATLQDFAWWSGLKISDVKAGLEMAGSQLTQETIKGQVYWTSAQTPASRRAAPAVYLLPGFDEYILGYQDRSAVLDPSHALRIVPGNNGMFMPTIIFQGRVDGIWKRVVKKKSVSVTAELFDSWTQTGKRAFAAAAQRYAQFLGLPCELPEDMV